MTLKKQRCAWVTSDPLYCEYHDQEWGRPIKDDQILFEYLVLESFQAGLNWLTILKKREYFRQAFDQFNYQKIAQYDDRKVVQLLKNTSIIRHKGKIIATINNAKQFILIQQEWGSFSQYLWHFVDHQPRQNYFETAIQVPSHTELSDNIAQDLKTRNFKFVGSTTIYAFMQAVGIVNDHTQDCFLAVQNEEMTPSAQNLANPPYAKPR